MPFLLRSSYLPIPLGAFLDDASQRPMEVSISPLKSLMQTPQWSSHCRPRTNTFWLLFAVILPLSQIQKYWHFLESNFGSKPDIYPTLLGQLSLGACVILFHSVFVFGG
jgi:hypothetical protein